VYALNFRVVFLEARFAAQMDCFKICSTDGLFLFLSKAYSKATVAGNFNVKHFSNYLACLNILS